MGIDSALAVVGARRTLRRLELEAYASVITAFRAQGPLTGDKKSSLEQLGKLLGISSERHRAEVRRAVNDELLSAIAGCVCPNDSEVLWRSEGQKLASTNPRFVARQLSHLPQLLTSAAVSSALGLQSLRADPDARKNTSAQVQNVLKFIISQNPLNAASAAKQQLGKISLSPGGGGSGGGKTVVKSPSKSPAAATESSVQSSTTTTTTTSAPIGSFTLTASPVKKEDRPPATTTPGITNPSISFSSSPTKSVSSSPLASLMKSEVSTGKTASKFGGGGKASMLVGLLEGRSDATGDESASTSDTAESTRSKTVSGGEGKEGKEEEKKSEKEKEGEGDGERKMTESKPSAMQKESLLKATQKDVERAKTGEPVDEKVDEAQSKDHSSVRGLEAEASEEVKSRNDIERDAEKGHADQAMEKAESKEPDIERMEIESGKKAGEGAVKGKSGPELVCDESMPQSSQPREKSSITPASDHPVTHATKSGMEKKVTASSVASTGSVSGATVVVSSVQAGPVQSSTKSVEAATGSGLSAATSKPRVEVGEVKEQRESRKRPCPTDLSLSPPPLKKPHVAAPSQPQPRPPIIPTIAPSSSVPPSMPPPQSTESSAKATRRPSTAVTSVATTTSGGALVIQPSPSLPPPLLLMPSSIPPFVDLEVQQRKFRKDTSTVSVSVACQVEQAHHPLKMLGGVTIQHLPPSLNLPTSRMPLQSEASMVSAHTKLVSTPQASVRPLAPSSLALPSLPPVLSFMAHPSLTTHSLASIHTPPPTNTTPLQSLPIRSMPVRTSAHFSTVTPLGSSAQANIASALRGPAVSPSTQPVAPYPPPHGLLTPSDKPLGEAAMTSDDVTAMSSVSSDEALIRELCSEATNDTTAAALASQLGLEFLDQNLLGGLDLMQLVNSPIEPKMPTLDSKSFATDETFTITASPLSVPPVLSAGVAAKSGVTTTPTLPDTTQLLTEALTSLSTPSTPLLPGPPFPNLMNTPLFTKSPSLSSNSPVLPPQTPHQEYTPTFTPSLLTSLPSPFTPHTPTILTPHTHPSLSSPLTPEILPDLENLSSVNEADLLEGIPPELAETIQALAQFDQQNYQSPL